MVHHPIYRTGLKAKAYVYLVRLVDYVEAKLFRIAFIPEF